MRSIVRLVPLLFAALLLASCAGPEKLARQSDEALARGDVRKAYDRALRAIEKDPMNQPARDAYDAASRRVAADDDARVRALASADSLGAADLVLQARQFRLDVARHGVALDRTPQDDALEQAMLATAARTHYRRGREAMTAHRPKAAVDEYNACRRYDDGYADVATRVAAAFRAATARVALLPFADGVGVAGLSQETASLVQGELDRRASSLRFTQLVAGDEVAKHVTVAQLRELSRTDAIALGRKLGADWVVVGHYKGLRSSNSERDLTVPLYHRIEGKDDKGATVVRWEESSLRVITRERDVTLAWDFDVLQVATGAVLAHREPPAHSVVRIAWSDFRPEKDCDRYALLPPDVRSAEPDRAKKLDAQWKDHLGSWPLKDLLEHSRDQRSRATWSSRYRGEFYGDTRQRPVWLGELPSEDDMAFVALHEAWKPVLAALTELDAKD